ncbi:MAG: hypothetical protein RBR68_14335 [Tenuifilaceae bacterium]|nr:hypothetical protein [Tenuifilaceae bacterium]
MSKYSEDEVMNYLYRNGIRLKENSKVIDVKSGNVGIKTLGMLDYLEKECNYVIRFNKEK